MRRVGVGFALLAILCGNASGAHLLLSPGTAGSSRTVLLKLWLNAPSDRPAGLQWTFVYKPSHVTNIAVLGGPAVQEGDKLLTCNNSLGAFTCLATGLNVNIMASGLVALVRVTLARGVMRTIIPVYNSIGVSANGSEIPVESNAGFIH
jgi:hypothetical protein